MNLPIACFSNIPPYSIFKQKKSDKPIGLAYRFFRLL